MVALWRLSSRKHPTNISRIATTSHQSTWEHTGRPVLHVAALVGYTVYPVIPLTSGLEDIGILRTTNLTACILPRNGTTGPVIKGLLVSLPPQPSTKRCEAKSSILW